MDLPSGPGDPLLREAVEEYIALHARGDAPPPDEFAARFPDCSDQLRRMLSVLQLFADAAAAGNESTPGSGPALAGIPRDLGGYRIVRQLGQGGMGVVFEAVEERLGRRVALKVLPYAALDERRIERFRREAHAAGTLHHTNIVPVFGLHEQDGVHFYTMQCVDGRSLDHVIGELRRFRDAQRRPGDGKRTSRWIPSEFEASSLPSAASEDDERPSARELLARALDGRGDTASPGSRGQSPAGRLGPRGYCQFVAEVGLQVANALDYAHRHGVLHRDIKPSNLLLDPEGTVWITDFGLAKLEGTGDLTESGEFVGTGRYMAPERLEGEARRESDIYSLGITLYELVTLEPAFADRSRRRLFEKIAKEPPSPPSRYAAKLDPDLENIILRAIEKRHQDRYPSADAFATDLFCFLHGRPVEARRTGRLERGWRWCRRNPHVATLMAVVAVLLVGIAVASTLAASRLRWQLRATQLSEARATRWSAKPGRRWRSLRAIRRAAAIRPGADLRNEMVAALHVSDLGASQTSFTSELPLGSVALDGSLDRVAFRSWDGGVHVRNVVSGDQVFRTDDFRGVFPVFLSLTPDGRFLAIGSSSGLRVQELETRAVVYESASAVNAGRAYARPDSGGFGFCSDHEVVLVDLAGVSVRRMSLAGRAPAEEKARPARLAWSPDQRHLAVAYKGGRTVLVLSLETMEVVRTLSDRPGLRWVAWHPNGEYVATTGFDSPRSYVSVWAAGSGTRISSFQGLAAVTDRLSFVGEWHVTVDAWSGRVHVFDFRTGERIMTSVAKRAFVAADRYRTALWKGRSVELTEFTPSREYQVLRGVYPTDGKPTVHPTLPLAVVQDGLCFDLRSGGLAGRIPLDGRATLLRFLDQGKRLLAVLLKRGVVVLPVANLRLDPGTEVVLGSPTWMSRTAFTLAALSQDERTLYAKKVRSVYRLDLCTGDQVVAFVSPHEVDQLSTTPDGRYVAAGSWDRASFVQVWDRESDSLTALDVGDLRSTPRFSPDGSELAVSVQRYYLFFETGSWEPLHRIEREEASFVGSLAYSKDGRTLAYTEDRTKVTLVDRASGTALAALESPDGVNTSGLRFSADARYLLASGKLWDLGRIRAQLREAGLDWDPPFASFPTQLEGPLRVRVDE